MLKLEVQDKNEIHIRFQECEKLLTPLFLQALSAATTLHVLALLLFYVSPFKIHPLDVFPPVQVKIDLSLANQAVVENFTNEPLSKPQVGKIHVSAPVIPTHYHAELNRFKAYPRATFCYLVDSSIFEEQISQTALKIHLTGPLAKLFYQLRSFDIKEYEKKCQRKAKSFYKEVASYEIKIDNRTGKVIWFQPVFKPKRRAQKLAHKILRAMRFEQHLGFVTDGRIDFELMIEKKHDF